MKNRIFLTLIVATFTHSLNSCETPKETPLQQQLENGTLQWKIALKDTNPHTLLHRAIIENLSDVIQFLLRNDIEIDYPNENGLTPLTVAVLNGSKQNVRFLLEKGANPNPPKKWNNMSLLEIAINMNDDESSLLLVQHGADVNAKNTTQGVLSLALDRAKASNPELQKWKKVIQLMIEKGANTQIYENRDCPFMKTVRIAGVLHDKTLMQQFLNKGFDINKSLTINGKEHTTPLIKDIEDEDGTLASVTALVEFGADINLAMKCPNGIIKSPVSTALDHGNFEVVQYLLQKGARG